MKTLLYTMILLTSFGSCRKLERMMERGEYNQAIVYATEKLAGKKKKKTEHVKALEEAFHKLTQRDLEHISYLNATNNPEHWDEIVELAETMHYRQRRITPFLPLVSKDGYAASFDMVDTYAIKAEAIAGAADYYYNKGSETLALSKLEDDPYLARRAFDILGTVSRYKLDYRDTPLLRREAQELGIVNILIDVVNEIPTLIPTHTEDQLLSLDLSRANGKWRRFHLHTAPDFDMDYVALLELNHIDLSPERETVSRHTDERQVKDGWTYAKDNSGRAIIDSSGNKVKIDKFKNLRAEVTEVYRKKWATVAGRMKLIDANTESVISHKHLEVEAIFEDYATSYRGDKKALCKHDHPRLRSYSEPFPSDLVLINDATDLLKGDFITALHDLRI